MLSFNQIILQSLGTYLSSIFYSAASSVGRSGVVVVFHVMQGLNLRSVGSISKSLREFCCVLILSIGINPATFVYRLGNIAKNVNLI
jgi:hypothetical protein